MTKKARKALLHQKKTSGARSPKTVKFPCMLLTQGNYELVAFVAPAGYLWDLVQINQRKEDKDEGYQRATSSSRVEKIAEFIESGNMIPNNVLVSFDHARLRGDGKVIEIENRADAGWVIDGQHRLSGGHRANKDISFVVVSFIGLPLDEQINCFVTVNREQKGVPSSLYYDLLKKLPGTRPESVLVKERAADLGTTLKNDENSPFGRRIMVTTPPKRGELSMTNWVRKVSPLIRRGSGILATFSDDDRAGIINNYYRGLERVFPREYQSRESIFFKTLGFGALMNTLPTVFSLALKHGSAFRIKDVEFVFKRVEHFDIESWNKAGSGSAAEIQAGDDLRVEIENAFSTKKFEKGSVRLE